VVPESTSLPGSVPEEQLVRDHQLRPYEGAPVHAPAEAEALAARLDLDVARAVLDNTGALVTMFDAQGRLLLFNRACEELSGWGADEVLGRPPWEMLIVPEERDIARREIPAIVTSGRGAVVEGTWLDRGGRRHLLRWHNTVLLDGDGLPDRMACVGVDITEQRRTELRLREMAETDMLTGLLNRRMLFEALPAALGDPHLGCGLLYCDLDGFKTLNDSRGHATGDQLLVQVAERLRSGVRAGDLVARVGGDEFVVLCPGIDAPALEALAARVAEDLCAPYELASGPATVGASIGTHLAPPGTSADDAVAVADARMYAVKRDRSGHALRSRSAGWPSSSRVAGVTAG
jgi:diguanylate cyclase (GGDEF)-like protein/PAS domain S-box-containing protein